MNNQKYSAYLKLGILATPLVTLYYPQIAVDLTPHPYIVISVLLIIIYYLYTHQKQIPQKISFLTQYVIFSLNSWVLCMLIGQIEDIIDNVYKLQYSSEILFCVKILLVLVSIQANIDLAFKRFDNKKYQDSQQLELVYD